MNAAAGRSPSREPVVVRRMPSDLSTRASDDTRSLFCAPSVNNGTHRSKETTYSGSLPETKTSTAENNGQGVVLRYGFILFRGFLSFEPATEGICNAQD